MSKVKYIVFILLFIFSTNSFAATKPTIDPKPTVSVLLNGQKSDIGVIKNGSEYYLSLDDISKALVYYVRWNEDLSTYEISDFNNWQMSSVKVNNPYIHVCKFKNKIGKVENELVYKIEKETNKKIPNALIEYNKQGYLSLKYLTDGLGVRIKSSATQIDITASEELKDVDDFFTGLNEELNIDDEAFEYFKTLVKLQGDKYPGEYKGSMIIAYLNGAKTWVNQTFWIDGKLFKNTWLTKCEDNQPYYGKMKRFSKIKVTGIDIDKVSFIVSLEGKGKYWLSLHFIDTLGELKDDFPYYITNVDPKKKFKWSSDTWSKMEKYDLWTGMTKEMVHVTCGYPDTIVDLGNLNGVYEQWVYNDLTDSSMYLYFENGKLVDWVK